MRCPKCCSELAGLICDKCGFNMESGFITFQKLDNQDVSSIEDKFISFKLEQL